MSAPQKINGKAKSQIMMDASFSLKVLRFAGLDPWDNSWLAGIKSFVTFITAFTVCATAVVEMVVTEWHVDTIVPAMEAFIGATQGLLRWYICFFHKKRMAKVLEDAKTFWNVDSVDPEDESNAKAGTKMVKKGMTVYIVSVFLTGLVAVVIPIMFNRGKMLPFKVWIPDRESFSYGFEILYIIQVLYLVTTVCLVAGVDSLYAILCNQLIVQFKLLNRKLEQTKNLKTKQSFISNLEEGILYHVKLIELAKDLGYMFFSFLLCQYIITLCGSCVELYRISESITDISKVSRFATYMTSLFIQMGVFCFLAEAVMQESDNTALAVYSSDWYSRDLKEVGIYLHMVIMRAQKTVTFSGGGMFVIGRALFFSVFKLSFSVFTLLTSSKQ